MAAATMIGFVYHLMRENASKRPIISFATG
ncbi:hypothetical protein Q669_19875 [Labrenzia sp. C1B10]|nr:hypothetical protein Q669_19875 [Labrenzia sp. C1B10]ERR00071.1 hypothetical protein Q675_10950 [Labrenzia sp. C1B70]